MHPDYCTINININTCGLISRVAFFLLRSEVLGTLALDLPTLILQRLVFLCLTV